MFTIINYLLIFSFILSGLVFGINPARAEINYSQIEVYKLENYSAKLKWRTYPDETKGMVYYGEDENDLSKSIGYAVYANNHEVKLTGLEKDKTYYYKIVSWNRYDERTESFLQTFSTNEMKDTIAPDLLEKKIVQTTRDAALIYWKANEKVKGDIQYGYSYGDYKWSTGRGGFKKENDVILYDLDTDQTYYVKLTIEDEGGNKKVITFYFRSGTVFNRDTELEFSNILPQNINSELLGSESVTIKWDTNLATKTKIMLGKESGRYDRYIEVNNKLHKREHKIYIEELTPSTTYYYKLEAYDALYGKWKQSSEMTFTTKSYINVPYRANKPINYSPVQDTDNDQLSDNFEHQIGTDPLSWDSDGDGYSDGNEFMKQYDPLVPGSTADTKLKPEYYMMPKRSGDYVQQKTNEIRTFVREQLGDVNISELNWQTLENAYIYGQYPADAITQAVRFGGKTVHPRINWTAWRNSAQYQEYINK